MLSDDELMDLLKRGKRSAFAELVDRHGSAVLGFCMKAFRGNRAQAEDLSQEIWYRVILRAGQYRAEGHFRAWLMTMTRNEAINQLRRFSRVRLEPDSDSIGDPPDSGDLEAELIRRHSVEELRRGIEKLSDGERLALSTWISDEMSYEQLADQLGSTVPAVRSLLFRARKNLKDILEGR